MHIQGRLYVFEGCDGAGKTTLTREFTRVLKSQGHQVSCFGFPAQIDGTLGKHVYGLHHEPAAHGIQLIHPASLQALHVAAHIDTIETAILPALERGQWVVLDRFWWSTWAYGIAAGVDRRSLKAMIDLELVHWRGILPTAVFLVERGRFNGHRQRMHTHETVAEYRKLVKRERRKHTVYIVRNNASVGSTLKRLLARVESPEL